MNHPTIYTQGHTATHMQAHTHAHGILIPTPNQWSSNSHFQKTKLMAGTMIKKQQQQNTGKGSCLRRKKKAPNQHHISEKIRSNQKPLAEIEVFQVLGCL